MAAKSTPPGGRAPRSSGDTRPSRTQAKAAPVEADQSVTSFGATDVCAVVVTRHPGPQCVDSLAALAPQVRELLILDNGSTAASFAPIEAAARRLGARIVPFGMDLGTAASLNFALESARQQGCKWLATFDQESRASAAMLARMLRLLNAYPERDQVALVTPVQVQDSAPAGTAPRPPGAAPPARWRVLDAASTSGALLNVPAVTEVGGFDTSLFTEYVDEELCLRLRRGGYQVIEASEVRMFSPPPGRIRFRQLSGRPPPQSWRPSRERRYYMTRNRALLWRRYWSFDHRWVGGDMQDLLYEVVALIRWEREVPGKLWMMARGLFDALRNVSGALRRHS